MHWGVRRYQNTDGSLTPKGKARLEKYKAKEAKAYDRVINRLDKSMERLAKGNLQYNNFEKYEKKVLKKGNAIANYMLRKDGVLNMSYDDMKWEKKLKRGHIAATAALGLVGNFATAGVYIKIDNARLRRGASINNKQNSRKK